MTKFISGHAANLGDCEFECEGIAPNDGLFFDPNTQAIVPFSKLSPERQKEVTEQLTPPPPSQIPIL